MISQEMLDLIDCLKYAEVSSDDSLAVCLLMNGKGQKIDELSQYILDNKPTMGQILEKAVELVGLLDKE